MDVLGAGLTATAPSRPGEFFDRPMYVVDVRGWPAGLVRPPDPLQKPVVAPDGARLRLWEAHPHDTRPLPPAGDAGALLDTARFSLVNSGNRTLRAPKRSWKVDLDPGDDEVAGMSCLNLKSMYNDPSQMREALAWRLFRQAGVPAPRHTYARFGINGAYRGLFSVIEQVDRAFLKERFGHGSRGNLYKVYCGQIGPGTLQHRVGPDGDDSGRQYRVDGDDPTYRLKSYSRVAGADGYDDLAGLVRVINGVGLAGGDDRFGTDAFGDSVREVFAVDAFLRWAGVNVLAGAWDNYFATPANYYLYNSGRAGDDVVSAPYFTFIPWDYDNTFGIDYVGTAWQHTDLLDWPASTVQYWRRNGGHDGKRSDLPLVQNLLRHREFRRYYLDHVEHLLDTVYSPAAIDAVLGTDGGGGLWDRVSRGAYLESDTPYGGPFTGRQFTNDEVFRNGFAQYELRHGDEFALGIHHYVRMRYDSARAQLAVLRREDPHGSSGATFPVAPEPLP
jgi:hypothetical protein